MFFTRKSLQLLLSHPFDDSAVETAFDLELEYASLVIRVPGQTTQTKSAEADKRDKPGI